VRIHDLALGAVAGGPAAGRAPGRTPAGGPDGARRPGPPAPPAAEQDRPASPGPRSTYFAAHWSAQPSRSLLLAAKWSWDPEPGPAARIGFTDGLDCHLAVTMCTALAAHVGLPPAADAVLRWLDQRMETRGESARLRDMASSAERWARKITELARAGAITAPGRLALHVSPADSPIAAYGRHGLRLTAIRPLARPGARRPATAGDVMVPLSAVPACPPDATVLEALEQMLNSGQQTLPVLDGPVTIGVTTLTSLAQAMLQTRGLPSIQRVETLLQPYTAVTADTPASAAAAIAADDQAGLVVVTRADGTPAGYLTPGSLLAQVQGTPPEDGESHWHAAARLPRPEMYGDALRTGC